MNEKTAERLNDLLKKSSPVTLGKHGIPQGETLHDYNGNASEHATQLAAKIEAVLQSQIPAQTMKEIQEAAMTRRVANTLYIDLKPYWWKGYDIPWEFTKRVWLACRAQIQTLIDADNKNRMDEYETYRIACEQGVAVPPTT